MRAFKWDELSKATRRRALLTAAAAAAAMSVRYAISRASTRGARVGSTTKVRNPGMGNETFDGIPNGIFPRSCRHIPSLGSLVKLYTLSRERQTAWRRRHRYNRYEPDLRADGSLDERRWRVTRFCYTGIHRVGFSDGNIQTRQLYSAERDPSLPAIIAAFVSHLLDILYQYDLRNYMAWRNEFSVGIWETTAVNGYTLPVAVCSNVR